MKYVFLGTVSILSILGFADLVRAVVFWLLKIPKKGLVLVCKIETEDEAEHTVRSVLEKLRWSGIPAKIIFVYNEDNTEVKEIISKIIFNYPDITLFSETEIEYNKIKEINEG